MKALTISEFINKDYDSKLELFEFLHIKVIYDSDIDEEINSLVFQYNNFVSQPFKPEMIEQLFEGWEKVIQPTMITYQYRDVIKKNIKYIVVYYNNSDKQQIHIGIKTESITKIPKNLDQFITICDLAGIELTFKEQQ